MADVVFDVFASKKNMTDIKKEKLNKIKLLATDVDGVLTDGTVTLGSDGTEYKTFNLLDGHGMKLWQRTDMKIALISGRKSDVTQKRADELGITLVYQPCRKKLECFEKLLSDTGLEPENIAYIGDDLLDLPVLKRVGFSVAVANAVDELKTVADYVTSTHGGKGAVREVIEYILKNTGQWEQLMARYLV